MPFGRNPLFQRLNKEENLQVMVNSNELYELPRPTLAKVVNIGGIGYNNRSELQLSEVFGRIPLIIIL